MNNTENNQNKKRWYQEGWGALFIILFPWLLFIVILQTKISIKKKLILSGILVILLYIFTPSPIMNWLKDKNSDKEIEQTQETYPENISTEEQEKNVQEQERLETEKKEKEKLENKKYNTENKRVTKELLSIISNDKFRPEYSYMINHQEARQLALANLDVAQDNISKLENIKCNLTCTILELYRERLKKYYTLRIEMIEIFLNDNITDNTMFKSTDSQLFKEKSREYLDYQYDIRKLTKSLRFFQNYNYSDN